MPRRQIELAELHEMLAFSVAAAHYKIWPGIVTAYHPGSKGKSPATIDVQPAVNDVRFDPEIGARISEPWPMLARIPVGFPKFGGYVVAGPLVVGDAVTLLGYDLDPSDYRASGRQSDPADTRRHGGGYWVALPFDITDPGAQTDPGNALVVGQPDGVQVRITPQGIDLGAASPSDAIARASVVDKFIQAVMGWTPAPNDGGAALKTALSTAGFSGASTSASATVKATP